jgi:hypothetical protein
MHFIMELGLYREVLYGISSGIWADIELYWCIWLDMGQYWTRIVRSCLDIVRYSKGIPYHLMWAIVLI